MWKKNHHEGHEAHEKTLKTRILRALRVLRGNNRWLDVCSMLPYRELLGPVYLPVVRDLFPL
jgi:hypothetical protein